MYNVTNEINTLPKALKDEIERDFIFYILSIVKHNKGPITLGGIEFNYDETEKLGVLLASKSSEDWPWLGMEMDIARELFARDLIAPGFVNYC